MSQLNSDASNRLGNYLKALAQIRTPVGSPLLSIILFGSAAKGVFASETSDVDLIIVLSGCPSAEDRSRIREQVSELEVLHGFQLPLIRRGKPHERLAARAAGHAMSCFVCSREDLLSGVVARILGLSPFEALFVDRIVLANILVSAVTVSGEDLVPGAPILPLRRLDVFKALSNFVNILFMSAMGFLLLPDATRYASGALKHSLHSCYFCYHRTTASVEEEIDFFTGRLGPTKAFQDLLQQRQSYRRSFSFVLRCAPVIVRMHLRTVRDNRFPLTVTRTPQTRA